MNKRAWVAPLVVGLLTICLAIGIGIAAGGRSWMLCPECAAGLAIFAIGAAALYARLARSYPRLVAWIGVAALISTPRVILFSTIPVDFVWPPPILLATWILIWATTDLAERNFTIAMLWGIVSFWFVALDYNGITLCLAVGATILINWKTVKHTYLPMAFLLPLVAVLLNACTQSSNWREQCVQMASMTNHLEDVREALRSIPDWTIFFAGVGAWSISRYGRTDRLAVDTLCHVVVLGLFSARFYYKCEGDYLLMAMIAPLAAIGAGRLLYRGTLTKSERIAPANWATVLILIAGIRGIVILISHAKDPWGYHNRLYDLLFKV